MTNEVTKIDDGVRDAIVQHLGQDVLDRVEQEFQHNSKLDLKSLPGLVILAFRELHLDSKELEARARQRFDASGFGGVDKDEPIRFAEPVTYEKYLDYIKTCFGEQNSAILSFMLAAPQCADLPNLPRLQEAANSIVFADHFKSAEEVGKIPFDISEWQSWNKPDSIKPDDIKKTKGNSELPPL